MAASRRRRDGEAKDEGPSILGKLVEEQAQQDVADGSDVVALFCGMKKSGKTSLIDRFINPTKEEKDIPKSTVALDYKYARYTSDTSNSKTIAHIYDLGGDESFDGLAAIPASASSVRNLVVAITADLSEPHAVIPSVEKWITTMRSQVEQGLQALAAESAAGKARVEAMQKERIEAYEALENQDRATPFPVQLVIFGTKCDALISDVDPEKRKGLCRALRYFAHMNGASLVFTSVKDKTAMNNMRNFLRQALFGVKATGKAALNDQLDPSKPLCVLAGKDSLQNIGAPTSSRGTGPAGWVDFVASLFPPNQAEKSVKKEGDRITEELAKYAEPSVDGMVEQRTEELHQYRRQVERNQRLAGEGLDAGKIGALAAS
mmetsp:Transcript_17374/g.40525  ORF Transcript_17374/g.40525 Transcript_17374/m.40525 type:complete len:376 (+) Transcript_17374:61-1188(+)